MKRAHTITFSTFIKPEEDEPAITKRFLSLIPLDLEQEKIPLQRTISTGFNERKILILKLKLTKERHTNAFLDFLNEKLSGAQQQQLREQEDRVDDHCHFYLRFQKQHLPKLVFTDKGDCIHCKISLAAFPKKRDIALRIVKEIFK
ncbi:hypothetical protein GF367_04665 [Candidatus Woesearchaeota archaeon]|nr:hypothetical protein [Candidatus Woesearchaeota archaeon]